MEGEYLRISCLAGEKLLNLLFVDNFQLIFLFRIVLFSCAVFWTLFQMNLVNIALMHF